MKTYYTDIQNFKLLYRAESSHLSR